MDALGDYNLADGKGTKHDRAKSYLGERQSMSFPMCRPFAIRSIASAAENTFLRANSKTQR